MPGSPCRLAENIALKSFRVISPSFLGMVLIDGVTDLAEKHSNYNSTVSR